MDCPCVPCAPGKDLWIAHASPVPLGKIYGLPMRPLCPWGGFVDSPSVFLPREGLWVVCTFPPPAEGEDGGEGDSLAIPEY